MAKVKITGHASGTGILTVTAPNTSTDRTITLPDATGTLLTEVADNSITLAKMASGTDGNIISYDASGDPVAIATGTDGQVLTSTGAGSPPAFEDAAAGGATTMNGLTDVIQDISNFTDSLLIQTNSNGSAPTTGTLSSATGNVGIGKGVFGALTTGDYDVGIGYNSLAANTTAGGNTALGGFTLQATTTGNDSTALGYSALAAATTALKNTAVGAYASQATTTGGNNTTVGYEAGDAITTGGDNICIGSRAGDNITTGNGNIVIGCSIDVPTADADAQINIDNVFRMQSNGDILLRPSAEDQNAFIYADNRILSLFGDNANFICSMYTGGSSGSQYYFNFRLQNNTQVGSITTNSSTTAYNTSSDYRLKENVNYDWDATTRLKQLKPARFNWIADETNTLQDGFLAHEVSSIVPIAITGEKDAMEAAVLYTESDVLPEGKSVGDVKFPEQISSQVIDESKLVPLLVKTIQELEARITALEA